jgi:hypothetical protein
MLFLGSLALALADTTVPVQGFFVDADGAAAHGTREVVVTVSTSAGGAPAFSETLSVQFDRGSFSLVLGAGSGVDDALWASAGDRWLTIALTGQDPSAPVQVGSVPRAARAEVAGTAERLGDLAPEDVALAGHDHAFGEITGINASTAWPGTASFNRMLDVNASTAWPGTASFNRLLDVTSSTAWPGTASFNRLLDVTSSTAWPGTASFNRLLDVNASTAWPGTASFNRMLDVNASTPWPGTVPFSRVSGLDSTTAWPGTAPGYVRVDGTTAMTGALQLPASLPSAATHAVSKSYADSTLLGVRPTSVLKIRGTGQNCTTGCDRDVIVNGVDQTGNGRGLTITTINRNTHAVVETRAYDTHGLTTDSDAMATFLNAQTSEVFVVVASWDAWTTALTDTARQALARVGSTMANSVSAACCDDLTPGRTAYALVGIPGNGPGSGIERSNPSGIGQAELDVILMGRAMVGQGNAPLSPQMWSVYGAATSVSSGAWADIPGASLSFVLGRRATVKMEYALSFSTDTASNHCGFRFVVDTAPRGDATYGNAIHMGSNGSGWWQSHADMHVENLGPGAHSVKLQIRAVNSGACVPDGGEYSRPWLTATAFPY